MIRVTIFNEYIQEQLDRKPELLGVEDAVPSEKERIRKEAEFLRSFHHGAIHNTLKQLLEEDPEIRVCHIATQEMEQCGLSEDVLEDTDVLIWWSHTANERLPDEVAERVQSYILRGVGFIPLHSAAACKPLQRLLGTGCSFRWREGEFERVWKLRRNHLITRGIPEYFELEQEEMYGELFDIPEPDELIFLSWYRGGEVFRSGCVWYRGNGRIFYFQPGHEINKSYFNEHIRRILRNAVRWAAALELSAGFECFEALSPERNRSKDEN